MISGSGRRRNGEVRSDVALKEIGGASFQALIGRWNNNRAENSHPPFRRRERAMQDLGG
jgi:putative transposase